jgi:hypothetical protein
MDFTLWDRAVRTFIRDVDITIFSVFELFTVPIDALKELSLVECSKGAVTLPASFKPISDITLEVIFVRYIIETRVKVLKHRESAISSQNVTSIPSIDEG